MNTEPTSRKINILLLCDYRSDIAATVRDHIDSLVALSRHQVFVLSILGNLPQGINLNHFDAVVIHYSLVASRPSDISRKARQLLREFGGLKAIFVQDEYRFVDATIAAIREIGVHLLFTCVPEREIEKVYPASKLPGVRRVNVLTGYVPESLLGRQVPSYGERAIDVGYRARKLPAWLGELGQEKCRIGARFQRDAQGDGLVLDISFREEDRLYGEDWIDFVCRCKAMLGVESGASVFDFTGEIQRAVEAHAAREPSASFEKLRDLYFRDHEGKIVVNQISPRCFEAAALRTLMILYEGEYSGRMTAGRHYLALKKDHSNHAEVVAILKDKGLAQAIIDAAYEEVACNPANTMTVFVRQFDEAMMIAFWPPMAACLLPLEKAEFEKMACPTVSTRLRRFRRRAFEGSYRFLFATVLRRAKPETREMVQAWIKFTLRPIRLMLQQLIS
jgi:hypothetical protein